jgi:ribosomal protein S18 acetylase RimI-like enzyme
VLEPVVPGEALARRLAAHEAAVHLSGARELRDLGDAILLYDPTDPEPFWNRIVGTDWPADAGAFTRRLDEVITLFATLGRQPHIRTLPSANRPVDLGSRLVEAGFRLVGADRSMILEDPAPSLELVRTLTARPGLRLEHVGRGPELWAMEVARLLAQAFDVETDRMPALGAETIAAGRRPGGAVVLLFDAGIPAATARRISVNGGTYLSSIGTAPGLQGHGLGSLVTAIAVAEAVAEGTRFIHLLVETTNQTAIRVYERLGFVALGEPILDLLVR